MAKVHRVILNIIDFEEISDEDLHYYLTNTKYLDTKIVSHEKSEEFEWEDDHPLNKFDTCDEEFERIFKEEKITKVV